MKDFQYITNSSPAYIESLYQDYIKDPNSVDPEYKKFFEGFDFALSTQKARDSNGGTAKDAPILEMQKEGDSDWKRELAVYRMILGYRNKGHLIAKTNPIRERKDRGANLNIEFYGLSEADLEKKFEVGNLVGLGNTTLKEI